MVLLGFPAMRLDCGQTSAEGHCACDGASYALERCTNHSTGALWFWWCFELCGHGALAAYSNGVCLLAMGLLALYLMFARTTACV